MNGEQEQYNEGTPKEFKEAENLLKDRCTTYVILAMYDDSVTWVMSNKTAGYGLLCRAKQQLEAVWDNEDTQDLDKEF